MAKILANIIYICICLVITSGFALSATTTHKVKSGESLYSISKKYRVSINKLKSQNNLKSNKLNIGQRLIIKQDTTPKRSASVKPTVLTTISAKSGKNAKRMISVKQGEQAQSETITGDNDGEFIEYNTRKDDTLEKIASKFNVDPEDILHANEITDNKIKIGRVLLIPRVVEDKNAEKDTEEEFVVLSNKNLKPWKSSDEKQMLVKVAKSFVGAPYKYGGNSVRGLDCSAYVKKIYDIFDVPLPRSAREQFKTGQSVSKDELSVGDLVFFRTKRYIQYPTHVGIYIGDGCFIHSSSSHNRIGVRIDTLATNFYTKTYAGAVRVKRATNDESADSKKAVDTNIDNF